MNKGLKIERSCLTATLVIVINLICSGSYAQDAFHVGISAGVQNTLLTSEGRSEIDVKNAFNPLITADIEYRLEPWVGFQSGLGYALYSQNTSEFRNNFSFLSIPLYLKIGGFKKEKRKLAFSMFGGPNFKFLMAANNIYQDEKTDISEYTTDFHLDYTLAFGLKNKLTERFVLESHLTISSWGGTFNNVSFDGFILQNFNYGLLVGLKYRLKKD